MLAIARASTTTTSSCHHSIVQFLGHQQPTTNITRRVPTIKKNFSTKTTDSSSTHTVLDADTGALSTRVHHIMTTSLAVLTPLYFLVPDSYTDGIVNQMFGVVLSTTITAHSWIGMNYVARDYVPKISYKLLGPVKILNAGLAVVTLLGLSKICISSPGGLKGVVQKLWTTEKKPKKTTTTEKIEF